MKYNSSVKNNVKRQFLLQINYLFKNIFVINGLFRCLFLIIEHKMTKDLTSFF